MATCLSVLLNESTHNILYIKKNTECCFLFVFQGKRETVCGSSGN